MRLTIPNLAMGLYNSVSFTRPLLASARGYQLRMWRYGPDAERLVDEALARERWPAARWREWQEEQLARTLHRALNRVPFYRQHWAERRRRGDQASAEILSNWPILEKETLRNNPAAFLADDQDKRKMRMETTSGTTGNPVRVWFTKDTTRAWYALCEARFRRWNGISRHDRWAFVGAQLVAPGSQTEPPFWVWNKGLNQLYMSAYHISPAQAPHYLRALAEHRVKYLWGHSSALETLARAALRIGPVGCQLDVVLSSSEPFNRRQRELVSQAFQCPVRETYGMTEIASAASECSYGRLHLWPEVGWMELANTQRQDGKIAGDLLSTGFLNQDMPLIRFRFGDRASFGSEEYCECGRTLPLLDQIEGRISDTLITPSGRRVSPSAMEVVFDTDLDLREAQIVQESLHKIRLLYVPGDGFTPAMAEDLVNRIRGRLGDVEVQLDRVQEIPRGASSKFQAVICKIPMQKEELADVVQCRPVC